MFGKSCNELSFRTFKQWACKGKILVAHSKVFQKSLHLSDTASKTFNATLLLQFTHLFKTLVWKTRCVNQVKWELDHKISQKQKCSQDLDSVNEEDGTPLDNMFEGHRPGLLNQDGPEFGANLTISQIQVLDDLASPVRPLPIYSN